MKCSGKRQTGYRLSPCTCPAKYEFEGKWYCGYHHPGKQAERQITKLQERIASLTAIVEKSK